MPGKFGDIRRNPSGRPLMSDIVAKPSRAAAISLSRKKKEIKMEKEVLITIRREEGGKSHKPGKIIYIIAGVAVFLVIAFLSLNFFSSAEISIVPKQEFIEIAVSFKASGDLNNEIALESVSFEETIESEGEVDDSRNTTQKAKGQVVIYNAYSALPQTLVASTRLEAPNGKIYRIPSAITVPGAKSGSGVFVPGSIEVEVFADNAGAEYNLGLSDFTIPGFKGTQRYQKIYARSKTEISGGFSGASKVVLKEDIDLLLKEAEDGLRSRLREKIGKDLPGDVILLDDAVDVVMTLEESVPTVNSPGEKVKISAKGIVRAMALKKSDIEEKIISSNLSLNSGEAAEIHNLNELKFKVLAKDFDKKSMEVEISGKANFVWLFDEEKLKGELTSTPRDARMVVFEGYSGILRAEISIKPSWWPFFPKSTERVYIKEDIRQSP